MLSVLLLILGFVLLIFGANFLVDGASALAKRLKISNLVIGLTVVAFGTSAPELTVSIIAALKGSADLALANVIGSNNFNTFIIIGIAAMIYPLGIGSNTIWKEIPFSLLAAVVLLVMLNDSFFSQTENMLARPDAIVLLFFFVIFIYYSLPQIKHLRANHPGFPLPFRDLILSRPRREFLSSAACAYLFLFYHRSLSLYRMF